MTVRATGEVCCRRRFLSRWFQLVPEEVTFSFLLTFLCYFSFPLSCRICRSCMKRPSLSHCRISVIRFFDKNVPSDGVAFYRVWKFMRGGLVQRILSSAYFFFFFFFAFFFSSFLFFFSSSEGGCDTLGRFGRGFLDLIEGQGFFFSHRTRCEAARACFTPFFWNAIAAWPINAPLPRMAFPVVEEEPVAAGLWCFSAEV